MPDPNTPSDPAWTDTLDAAFQAIAKDLDGAIPARIIREDRGLYRANVVTDAAANGEPHTAEVTGAFRNAHFLSQEFPAVGDWVVATPVTGERKLRIHAVLSRRTAFTRTAAGATSEVQVVAANVDTVFIVMGLDHDFNPRRVERYIALAYESGANPVVILSKRDIAPNVADQIEEIETVAIGVPVHAVSSIEHEGLEALAPYLKPGKTVACLGSSGAGKSTLINALIGEAARGKGGASARTSDSSEIEARTRGKCGAFSSESNEEFRRKSRSQPASHFYHGLPETMATGAVREDDSRGRHTTTHRQLLPLPSGCSLIDTPGMRELQLTGGGESLESAFEDVQALAAQCRFRDCDHQNEPGCAIQAAIKDGHLDPARHNAYQKLQRELAYNQRRQSESYNHQERQRTKALGKMYKRIQNEKKNRR